MRMKSFVVAAMLAVSALVAAPHAEAKPSDYRSGLEMPGLLEADSERPRASRADRSERSERSRRAARAERNDDNVSERRERRQNASRRAESYSGSVGARPSRWCGWWMRTQRGGGPEYNLAANWRRYGSASGPQVGAVVVWPHHVGQITGRASNGQWIVQSGNDGGQVRERARSVSGATFRMG
jgi:hypothetical protein